MRDSGCIEKVFLSPPAIVVEQDLFVMVNVPSRDNDHFVAVINAEARVCSFVVVGVTGG